MVSKVDKEHFWSAVAGCLVLFHHLQKDEARQEADKFRNELERELASNPSRDIIYHDEPFNFACRLAGLEVKQSDCEEAYFRILDAKDPLETALQLSEKRKRATTAKSTAMPKGKGRMVKPGKSSVG